MMIANYGWVLYFLQQTCFSQTCYLLSKCLDLIGCSHKLLDWIVSITERLITAHSIIRTAYIKKNDSEYSHFWLFSHLLLYCHVKPTRLSSTVSRFYMDFNLENNNQKEEGYEWICMKLSLMSQLQSVNFLCNGPCKLGAQNCQNCTHGRQPHYRCRSQISNTLKHLVHILLVWRDQFFPVPFLQTLFVIVSFSTLPPPF